MHLKSFIIFFYILKLMQRIFIISIVKNVWRFRLIINIILLYFSKNKQKLLTSKFKINDKLVLFIFYVCKKFSNLFNFFRSISTCLLPTRPLAASWWYLRTLLSTPLSRTSTLTWVGHPAQNLHQSPRKSLKKRPSTRRSISRKPKPSTEPNKLWSHGRRHSTPASW